MKRIIVFFALLLSATLSYAQYSVTPDGLVSDSGKPYDVYSFEGKSQESLYSIAYKYIARAFVSPKDVISAKENEVISLNAVLKVNRDNPITKTAWINTTLSIEFKEGKIRINLPSINRIYAGSGLSEMDYYFTQQSLFQENGIFSQKDKLKDADLKASIENVLNGFVKSLLAEISNGDSEW